MAILRIAFAAAAVIAIAPHIGGQAIDRARPAIEAVRTFCSAEPETCLRLAQAALGERVPRPANGGPESRSVAVLGQPTIEAMDRVPLPPARPLELRPALR